MIIIRSLDKLHRVRGHGRIRAGPDKGHRWPVRACYQERIFCIVVVDYHPGIRGIDVLNLDCIIPVRCGGNLEFAEVSVQVRGYHDIGSNGLVCRVADDLQVTGKVAFLRHVNLPGHIQSGNIVLPHHDLPAHALLSGHLDAVEWIDGAVRDNLEYAAALDRTVVVLAKDRILTLLNGTVFLEVKPHHIAVIKGLWQDNGIVLQYDINPYNLTIKGYVALLFPEKPLVDVTTADDKVSHRDPLHRVEAGLVGVQ